MRHGRSHTWIRLLADFLFPQRAIYRLENRIMKELDTLKAQMDDLVLANNELNAKADASDAKTDTLIASMDTVLVRLKELQDAANQGGNVTAADIQPLIEKAAAAIATAKATSANLDAQDLETEAAIAKAAAATTETPAPPSDDAFVPVGGTRFSDGQLQTEESYAAAVAAWNAAHPEGPVAG